MEHLFLPFEESRQLENLGCDERSLGIYYTCDGKEWMFTLDGELIKDILLFGGRDLIVPAILFQQVFDWARNEWLIDAWVEVNFDDGKRMYYYILDEEDAVIDSIIYETFEEAQLECVRELIRIIKTNILKNKK